MGGTLLPWNGFGFSIRNGYFIFWKSLNKERYHETTFADTHRNLPFDKHPFALGRSPWTTGR
jgi:hypothetical protein